MGGKVKDFIPIGATLEKQGFVNAGKIENENFKLFYGKFAQGVSTVISFDVYWSMFPPLFVRISLACLQHAARNLP